MGWFESVAIPSLSGHSFGFYYMFWKRKSLFQSRNPFVIRSLLRIELKVQKLSDAELSQSLRYQVTPSDAWMEHRFSWIRRRSQSLRYQVTPSDNGEFGAAVQRQFESQSLRYQVTPSDSLRHLYNALEKKTSQSLRYQVTPSDEE